MKFSIVIPTYNRASFLPRAIESVLAQTYTNWELIIVDDGSTDKTQSVILEYQDKRIRYIYQDNAERSAARNNGINNATGDYICFMDSDEYIDGNRLELLHSSIESNGQEIACFYTDIRFEGNRQEIRYGRSFNYPINKDALFDIVIGTPQICCAIEILHKHQFNPNISIGEDMELLFRIADEYPLIYIPNQATIVEFDHGERSVSFKNKSIAAEKELKTLQLMFSKGHPASGIKCKNKRTRFSKSYFNASTNYVLALQWKGFYYLVRSILLNPFSAQTKYKLNIVCSFVFMQKNKIKLLYENGDNKKEN